MVSGLYFNEAALFLKPTHKEYIRQVWVLGRDDDEDGLPF